MIEGQGADVEGEGKPASAELVHYIHRHKTAALIETCCRLGAACARVSDEVAEQLARYGQHLGVAFQIADDMLDETSTAEQLGKTVGKDAAVAKQTYPAVFGMAESERQAVREMGAALAALEVFGGRADRLRELARYVIRRDH
jgi:geranylgeranyl diphosphate synthase type II